MRTDWRSPEHLAAGFDLYYRFHCETNDCSPDLAVERWIADQLGWDFEQRCTMALFHGATYAGPCESMFARRYPLMTADMSGPKDFFRREKRRLLFSPDCKHRKRVFDVWLDSVGATIRPYGTLGKFVQSTLQSGSAERNYRHLRAKCQGNFYHWGRMGHWCFSEAVHRFTDVDLQPPTMEFVDGRSHTAGWAYCAQAPLPAPADKRGLRRLERLATEYLAHTGWQSSRKGRYTLETACCNYKRQHHGTRYAGCYIDEQHWEIEKMQHDWPEEASLWDLYLEGRAEVIPGELLYEQQSQPRAGGAYIKSWNSSMQQYGRMLRVEAWAAGQPQLWCELDEAIRCSA